MITLDADDVVQQVAREVLGSDPRVSFVCQDGLDFIRQQKPATFDLVFADAMPGKYEAIDETLALVRQGGFYISDDMLPQPNWPASHQERVDRLVMHVQALKGWSMMSLAWGAGFLLAARRSEA